MQKEQPSSSLQRSKRFATIALVVAVLAWLALMLVVRELVKRREIARGD